MCKYSLRRKQASNQVCIGQGLGFGFWIFFSVQYLAIEVLKWRNNIKKPLAGGWGNVGEG